jgi:hypothetical protein
MKLRTATRSLLAFTAIVSCSAAQAQAFRAYLSVDGSDANPCTVQLPCRLLPKALSAIVDGGEVWMLDSANYNTGPVTVDKSASILAVPGAVGSLVALGGPAVSITAPSLTVSLRNLVFVPFAGSGGTDGVNMTGASTLIIEKSLFANLPGNGVSVSGAGKVKIAHTIFRNNAQYAVHLDNGAGAEISATQMLANAFGGVEATSTSATTTTASVSDSIISGGTAGLFASAPADGAVARLFATRTTIENTFHALDCEGGGAGSTSIAISYSTIVKNNYAWYQAGPNSVIRTLGNNHITDNTTSLGTLTPTPLQ